MNYLVEWFNSLGGQIVKKQIDHIDEALKECDLIVNCTGLGSLTLAGDHTLYPVRGQVVRVKPTGICEAIFDDEGRNKLAYIIPRSKDIVLGGTAQENDWELAPRAADRDQILRKARELVPELGEVEILNEGVGLRPARPAVRLEAESIGDKTVIHNYGHGGAGFTLSWGCAEEVIRLITNDQQSDQHF